MLLQIIIWVLHKMLTEKDSGQSVEVKVNGSIDTNQTGLSPGFTYYINEINGDLENNTNNGSVQAGIATASW